MNGVNPLVQRTGKYGHLQLPLLYGLTAAFVAAGVGLGVGYAGSVVPLSQIERRVVAVVALTLLGIREAGWIRFPIPELKLRVPPTAVAGANWSAAMIWGGVLGFGFLTFIRFGVFWGMHATVIALGSPSVGALTGAFYGFSRTLPALILWSQPDMRERWLEPNPRLVFSLGPFMNRVGAAAMMNGAAVFAMSTWKLGF